MNNVGRPLLEKAENRPFGRPWSRLKNGVRIGLSELCAD